MVAWMQSAGPPQHRAAPQRRVLRRRLRLLVGWPGVRRGALRRPCATPVAPTDENPIATSPDHGSPCVGTAGPAAAAAKRCSTTDGTADDDCRAGTSRRCAPDAGADDAHTVAAATSVAPVTTTASAAADPVIRLSAVASEFTTPAVAPEVQVDRSGHAERGPIGATAAPSRRGSPCSSWSLLLSSLRVGGRGARPLQRERPRRRAVV